MDWNFIIGLGGFGVAVIGLLGTLWWRITLMIKDARAETATSASWAHAEAVAVRQELALHRLHVAETYVPNAAFARVTDQIMEAIGGVKDSVDQMRVRIDRAFDRPPAPTHMG
jgi:hypothetical protein